MLFCNKNYLRFASRLGDFNNSTSLQSRCKRMKSFLELRQGFP